MSQPDPKPGRQKVGDAVLQDIRDRIALGQQRYGRPLETWNGRKALLDLYEELLDAVMYLKQLMMEEGLSREGD